jgi:2-dehydro-3-deoxy-D-arabinonate dehydratase
MKVYKTLSGILIEHEGNSYLETNISWDALIGDSKGHAFALSLIANVNPLDAAAKAALQIVTPIGNQEVWAAGVTYMRSMEARAEESKDSGGKVFYDKVYVAERPELFFKATPIRCVGNNGKVNIRKDSTWNVPEPELALVINKKGTIIGYTVGNDMSSRSIEGENPLYLPQAKVYDNCAGIGPCIYLTDTPLSPDTIIKMEINRSGENKYTDQTEISRMKRTHTELAEFLYRECSFPVGAYLMTGTCLVPPNEFTLQAGDEIKITIEPIGTLLNIVA